MRWLLLAAVLSSAKPVHKQHHVTWADCYVVASFRSCMYHAVRPRRSRVTGWRVRCGAVTPIALRCVYFPIFKREPTGYHANYLITGYSSCETHGAFMSDGTSVVSAAGLSGAAATAPGYLGGLPFGTRVYIPSLHRTVTIHDRGDPAHFLTPHIDVFFGSDCSIGSNLAGRGSHVETVFIYA